MMKQHSFHTNIQPDTAIALPLFGVFLLVPPIISLFAGDSNLLGIPLIAVYVFVVWIGLIICAAILAHYLDPTQIPAAGDTFANEHSTSAALKANAVAAANSAELPD